LKALIARRETTAFGVQGTSHNAAEPTVGLLAPEADVFRDVLHVTQIPVSIQISSELAFLQLNPFQN
jgi:hypothetical protein